MSMTEEKITAAALRVFMRYGVQRSSMNDIAEEAGLARQTLYKSYANKDAILCATIRVQSGLSRQSLLAAWEKAEGVAAKIEVFLTLGILASFDVIKASPHAMELADGFSDAGRVEIAKVQHQIAADLAAQLAPAADALHAHSSTPERYATFLQKAALGLRDAADTRPQLQEMLADLQASALALLAK